MFFPHNDGTTDMEKWLRKCNSSGSGRNMAKIRIKSNKKAEKKGEHTQFIRFYDVICLHHNGCVCVYLL